MTSTSALVEQQLSALCLDMAKRTLRSDDLPLFHNEQGTPQPLYAFLADYFAAMNEQKKHEESIAVRPSDVAVLARVLLEEPAIGQALVAEDKKALDAVAVAHGAESDAEMAAITAAVTATGHGPFVAQRWLRERLVTNMISVAAMGEAVELCRLVDQRQGAATPFGQVNLTHFTAVYATLAPTESLFGTIALMFDAFDARDPLLDVRRVRMLHCWAAIDVANRDALQNLIAVVLRHPRLTVPLLLDAHPAVEHIATPGYGATIAAEEQRAAPAGAVVYTEDEVAAAPAPMPVVAPTLVSYGEDDDDDAPAPPANPEFWNQLFN